MNFSKAFDGKKIIKLDDFDIYRKTENIYHINDRFSSFCTLVKGTKKALLIDTSWGIKNLRNLVEKIIDTPYEVVNTHAHPDHCFGNFQFDKVLTPIPDEPVYNELSSFINNRNRFFSTEKEIEENKILKIPTFTPLQENTTFDLGNLTVRTVPLYSHTPGSTGFLVQEENALISGDVIHTGVWLFMKESLPLAKCLETYKNTLNLPFDKIIASHAKLTYKKELIVSLIKNIEQVLSPDYIYTDENYEEIMGYKVNNSFYYGTPSCKIVIPDKRFI